ncbi:hypothetical protein [Streptacidiphilus anmyonensis]|uniref:hypothetical protein n=1 Tax=Streptacidiphilus anmyonensis TaxID=405782 RepID=UPI0005A6369F|nr:hypothetical protein [Streptacidiphilus anmyonensis]
MHTTLTRRSLAAAGAAALSAVLLLSGCSSSTNASSGASGGASNSASSASVSASGSASASATPGGGTSGTSGGGVSATGTAAAVVVTNADKGHTVTLHPGQTLEVVLSGGYWASPASSATSVLKLSGGPSFASPSPGQSCRPGVDCRAQQTEFVAVSAGSATVSSSRSNCGEAMRCTGSNGMFSVTVTVAAS